MIHHMPLTAYMPSVHYIKAMAPLSTIRSHSHHIHGAEDVNDAKQTKEDKWICMCVLKINCIPLHTDIATVYCISLQHYISVI